MNVLPGSRRQLVVRLLGFVALFGSLVVLCQTASAQPAVELQGLTNRVGKYQTIEFRIQVSESYADPFNPEEVDLSLQVTTPSGQRLIVPAFWCQDYERRRTGNRDWLYPAGMPGWKARFAPMETGRFQAAAFLKTPRGIITSAPVTFESVPSTSPGYLRVSRKDPRFFEFSEGQPFFQIGQNLAFIGSQQFVTLSKAEEIFGRLATNGANYLRIWTCCEDWAMAIEARKSAWGRSWSGRGSVVPMPDGNDTNRRCVKVSGASKTLNVDPSHPIALRPSTRYLVSGKVRTELGTTLELEIHRTKPAKPLASGSDGVWADFHHEFTTGDRDFWLDRMSFRLGGTGFAWLDDLSLKEAQGGPELLWEADVNRPARGFYNPLDCFMLDELLAAAEQHGIYLQLCLLTRDLYMSALKNASSPEYDRAIADARKTFRYAVARWGSSTHVAAWEYWNEMDPGLPTDRFYTELGNYLEQVDVYHHLRTTSTWGPSTKDCRHPKLDIADVHFYLRPSDRSRLRDEVEAVLDRTRWLREQAPNKPAHLGEFGLANEKWQPTEEMMQSRELVDFHNALWASTLAGASGNAMYWWWDRLDPRNVYPSYRPLSRFIADVPWSSGEIAPASATCTNERVRVIGLQSRSRTWLWLYHREASWDKTVIEKRTPSEVQGVTVELKGLPEGAYRVEWWDTRDGRIIREERRKPETGTLRLTAPAFFRDVASKITQ